MPIYVLIVRILALWYHSMRQIIHDPFVNGVQMPSHLSFLFLFLCRGTAEGIDVEQVFKVHLDCLCGFLHAHLLTENLALKGFVCCHAICVIELEQASYQTYYLVRLLIVLPDRLIELKLSLCQVLVYLLVVRQREWNLAGIVLHPTEEVVRQDAHSILIDSHPMPLVLVEDLRGAKLEPIKVIVQLLMAIREQDGFLHGT